MVAWVEPVDAETERQPSNPCRRQRWQTFEAVIILPLALMSASGPNSDLGAPEREVRFAPINGHRQVGPAGPFRADIVAKVENRATRKISRKLIFGLLRRCDAFQRHYGGPWSILDETIWSLTSPLVKRISGSKKFRSSPQKDFCNNICQQQT
jgi:hypothetical protein